MHVTELHLVSVSPFLKNKRKRNYNLTMSWRSVVHIGSNCASQNNGKWYTKGSVAIVKDKVQKQNLF